MFLRVLAPVIILFGAIAFRLYVAGENVKKNACVLNFGGNVMGVTAYQPDVSRDEFCGEIPYIGKTLIVFDAAEHDLRDMTAEIRVIRDIGPEEEKKVNLKDITEAYLPPQKYPGGTIVFEHVFDAPGKFVGLVTVEDVHMQRWTERLQLSVGRMQKRYNNAYMALAASVILGLAGYAGFLFWRRKTDKKV